MKTFASLVTLALVQEADAVQTNPIAKVIEMLSGLQAKIVGEGEEAQKSYDDFAEWCEDTSKDLGFEIKTGKSNIAELKATISEEVSRSEALTAKIEELASMMASTEADLQAATEIRTKEAADFGAESSELSSVVDTLGRAIGILEKEASGGASMLQLQNTDSVVGALKAMVDASMLSTADSSRITALVQSNQESADSEDDAGAPAAAVYENQSGGIVDVLGGLLEQAQSQLDDARKKETNALHNFEMLKQSLTDEVKFAKQESASAKKDRSASAESKASATGELEVTAKELGADQKSLSDLHANCMGKAQEFESATKGRGEELNALATAKKVIEEATGGATSQTYGLTQTSFLQLSSRMQSASNDALKIIRDLAQGDKSASMAQLAMRISSAMHAHSGSADPFEKVKGLIRDMLEKLESEADADATEKAFCDKEMAENNAKKKEMDTDIAKLTTKIDQSSARSTKLKGEVATLQKELAKLAKSKADAGALRAEEKGLYDKQRPELEQGIEGVKTALQVLRDYYANDAAHGSAEGAGTGIISLLEVCESDFEKGLAEMIATEESAAAVFAQEMKDNEMDTTMKDKDVEYKTKEHVGLDKFISTASGDRSGIQTELDAVLEYLKQLDARCIGEAESYASIKKRRDAELAGLKEALEILSGDASFLQKKRKVARVQKH